ncbi:MAG: nicotinate phosphoribosyltransferase [Patescibacteria group bacterium]|nr:nicotinate phosphoribosyltransferase [Patescibacteria group bacterium]
MIKLPNNFQPYTDVYFLRSLEILKKLNLNPFVRAQVFLRGNSGLIFGQDQVIEIIKKYSNIFDNKGKVYLLPNGEHYEANETVLLIEARIQDIIGLETIILGVLSYETTKRNDKTSIDLNKVTQTFKTICSLVRERPVYYFGARHWSFSEDAVITKSAFEGGAAGASTQIGADQKKQMAMGTIPHSLEAIFDWKYGSDRAVVESSLAFNKYINKKVPRIALVDYNNKETDDSVMVSKILGNQLFGVRVDTPGENIQQGGVKHDDAKSKYWTGKGVTIEGVKSLRETLDKYGFDKTKIVLSSGFGNIDKVRAFVEAEKKLNIRLFDSLGVGNVFDARISTMDIVGVGETIQTILPISKVGRFYKPNERLVLCSV